MARTLLAFVLTLVAFDGLACSGRVHIEVRDAGVYALDYAGIIAQQPGLADCRSDTLALLNRGNEVPIRIVGDSNGQFGPGSRIEWVGDALHGPMSWNDQYSNFNVYQLAAIAGSHARMREVAPEREPVIVPIQRRVHIEQDNLMLRLSQAEMKAGTEPDVWQWAKLTPVDAHPFTWNFDLADLDPRAAARRGAGATLTLTFRGVSSVIPARDGTKAIDHVVEVSVNGKPLPAQRWDGRGEQRRNIQVPLAMLKDKGNVLSVGVPQRAVAKDPAIFVVDVVMFNWMEVTYPISGNLAKSSAAFSAQGNGTVELEYSGAETPALYDGTGRYRRLIAAGHDRYRGAVLGSVELFAVAGDQALRPVLVRPVAELELRTDNSGYDYLMVAHPRLRDAIEPLARFHRARRLRTAVLDVDAVYDEFNGGIPHPIAIRKLVAWGMKHWQVKPRYLLLVGDASADILHDMRSERLKPTAIAMRPHPTSEELMLPTG
ncbi:MAG TPA: C25 family cysteine peptidase, partial [Rhodanobacteraceae bacterium]|nr:C25 family cysteine peptidase [Rhodanobacteraceae bacterium]